MFKTVRFIFLVIFLFLTASPRAFSTPVLPLFDMFQSRQSATGEALSVDKIGKTLAIIQRYYYDPERIDLEDMLETGLQAIGQKLPTFLVTFENGAQQFRVQIDQETTTHSYKDLRTLVDLLPIFADVLNWIGQRGLLEREYVKADDLQYAVCDGLLSTLDPHSNVLPPETFKEFQTQTEGSFGGVGIVIGMRDGYLTVIAPIAGTPASRAKVQSGDRIVRIDGEPSLNMPLNEAVDKLRGKVATTVAVTLERESIGELNITLKREVIQIESVQSALLSSTNPASDGGKAIGYVRIKSFQGDTYQDLLTHLQKLKSKVPTNTLDGLILDLRNNPGGLLDQAVEVSDLFLAQGPIVMTVGTGQTVQDIRMARAPGTEPHYPMVVLTNGGSASASEIVAAALKDNGRALVVGDQTFGKGSVQSIFNLDSDSAIKLTIAEYWTAARRSIQSVGISPDVRLFPMKISNQLMDLIANVRLTESDLEKHLENTNRQEQESRFKLSYFDETFFKEALAKKSTGPSDEEQPDFAEQAKEYDKEAHVEDDYWVTFSRNVLALYEPGVKTLADEPLARWVDQAKQAEGVKAAAALKQLNINWDPPVASRDPVNTLVLETAFKQDNKPVETLQAGKEALIEVKATNTGTTPLYRVLAVTKSLKQHFIFDDREFVFGKILPGESITAQALVKLPSTLPTYVEPITYDIYSTLEHKIGETRTRYAVTKAEKPRFLFAYTVADRAVSGTSSPLASNGTANPGELIDMTFSVKNVGTHSAEDVQINIKNESGKSVILEKGREELGKLAPQQEKKATLSFRLRDIVPDNAVSLELFISDIKSESILTTRMNFPIGTASGITPEPKTRHTPPTMAVSAITPLPGASTADTSQRFTVTGTLTDEEGVADLQAFLGTDKQCLQVATEKNKTTVPFTCTLEIDPKAKDRFFFLEGRDNEGLVERAIYGIPVGTPATEPKLTTAP